MKKLMMTTVAALGFAALAQADVLNSTGFEEYGENDFAVGRDDQGTGDNARYWLGTEGGDFSQTVLKTYEEAAIAAPANVPDAFTNAASNATFLSVDTGNDVMYRKAGADAGSVDLNQGAVFFDANVKFTASETDVEASTGDKLLVWLKGDDTTTNLIVTAGLYDALTGEYDPTNFTVDGDYAADTWYRLTVKAAVENEVTTFVVYIDKTQVSATYEDGVFDSFPSLVESGSDSGKLIEAAGFQGTGALDNVVWTTTDPFPAEGTYTLTFTGDEGFAGEMASVTVGDANVESFDSFEKAGIGVSVKEVTVVAQSFTEGTVTPTTEAEGVTFSKVTMVETEETDPENPEDSWTVYTYTFTVTVAEPAVDANYAIALSFVSGEVIEEDIDLATQSKLSLDKDSIKEGEAAPTVTVMVGDDTLTVGTDYTVTTEYVAGTSKAGTYTITVTAVENSGYTGSKSITFTVTAEEVVPETAEPGTPAVVDAETQEQAVAKVDITVPAAVAEAVGDDTATYVARFTKVASNNGGGTWTVSVVLTEAAVTELKADADAGVADLLDVVTGDAESATATVPAGFYWALSEGTSLDGMANGAGQISDGKGVSLNVDKSGDAGFYQLIISPEPIPATAAE